MSDRLGESPIWDSQRRLLYWVDILGQKIHSFDPESKQLITVYLQEKVTSIALRQSGGLIATSWKGFVLFDWETESLTPLVNIEEDLLENSFNDGKCDRLGRFWAGTINRVRWDKPTGSLYLLNPDKSVTITERNTICVNGLAWSPDDRIMYVVESFLYTIFAYDYDIDLGTLSNKRPFCCFPKEAKGFPDGITVDAEGSVWCAMGVLGWIIRIDPQGHITKKIVFPVPGITSCTFGGNDLETLYVTSSRENMTVADLEKYPLSGNLFSINPGVKGIGEPTAFF
jgi:sugar lactone lactonase YvrE